MHRQWLSPQQSQRTCLCTLKKLSNQLVWLKKVYLIAVKPTISHETNNVKRNLKEGETANLTCNATGYPEPTITWYREKEGKKYGKENQNYLCI